jgi:twitching motility protein PilT
MDPTIYYRFRDEHLTNEDQSYYLQDKMLDISIRVRVPKSSPHYNTVPDNVYRYRASFGYSRGQYIATFRMIKPKKVSFDNLNYNESCITALKYAFAKPSGITYITGPTGSGKSSTLAACINDFTVKDQVLDNKMIITLEDPIENIFNNTKTVRVCQKELHQDFMDWDLGIKQALREHPNFILIGECRTKVVICSAIEAARTGHQTATTAHSDDVGGTVGRLFYHLDNDKNLCLDLLLQLNLILSQKMIKSSDKYIVDTQYLIFDNDIVEILLDRLSDPNANIKMEINKIIRNPEYQKAGIAKDWSFPELHR